MKRAPRQALLPFGRKERVVNRQIKEKMEGKKISRGPGRPKSGRDVTPHNKREVIKEKTAVHVTLSFTKKVPNLRNRKKYNLVKRAFAAYSFVSRSVSRVDESLEGKLQREKAEAAKQHGFRLVHFAVLGDHLHLLCEADSAQWLSKGVQKICVSLARLLNADGVRSHGGSLNPRAGSFRARAGWIGKIFAERYHARYLKSEREISNALSYIFNNAKQHYGTIAGERFKLTNAAGRLESVAIDVFTSFAELHACVGPPPIAKPRGFLLGRAMRHTAWAIRRDPAG